MVVLVIHSRNDNIKFISTKEKKKKVTTMIITGTHPSNRKIIINKVNPYRCIWEIYDENDHLMLSGISQSLGPAQRMAKKKAFNRESEKHLLDLGKWTWSYDSYGYV